MYSEDSPFVLVPQMVQETAPGTQIPATNYYFVQSQDIFNEYRYIQYLVGDRYMYLIAEGD